jgi:hypothetical protein
MSLKSPFGPIGGGGAGGTGLPAGGTVGQIIVKQSAATGDAIWADSGVSYLPVPDNEETTTAFIYMGWESVSGGWLVRRRDRVTFATGDATVSNNGSYANLTAAWPDRAALIYA